MRLAELVFWASLAFIFYVYLGYPLLLWLAQFAFARPVRKRPLEPVVSIVIPAYNEGHVIAKKLRNTLELDYPHDRLEIVVVSDGSTDGTADIVRSVLREASPRSITLHDFPVNRGKTAAVNDVVRQLRGEIVVFSDAASMLGSTSIRMLAANFADPRVGAVSGVYRVTQADQSRIGSQEGLYWKYETFLKAQESRLDSVIGAHGALFALRKNLYPYPDPRTINDDFVIPVRVLQQGYRVVYEPRATACEPASEMDGFRRRIRIMVGNFEQLREMKGLLHRPLPLLFFLSHKAARLVVPAAMIAAAVATAALSRKALYAGLGLAQVAFYCLALLGAFAPLKPGFLRIPYYLCMLNSAGLVSLLRLTSARPSWR